MDGTLLPLGFKPTREDYTDFYGQKGTYTLTMLIICDHLHQIRYYHAGWPGSVHDERVFRNTKVCLKPSNHFSKGEYILSDSAITARCFVVPQHKKPSNGVMDLYQVQFNTICATPCVLVEHCIGTL